MVFSLVLPRIQEKTASSAREDYIVRRRTLHRLPENTTSSAGEHYIVCRRTLHRPPENTYSILPIRL
ncbi:MAG: hypothetical protein IJ142_07715 [Bacteroidaceae bacterium]|nr:hypothetical protein [Bacteroidaceae bacterium]